MANRATDVLRKWIGVWALPQHCVLCMEPGASLCEPCREDLPGLRAERCPVCAHQSVRAEICGQCLAHPPRYAKVSAAVSYSFPIDAVIRRLKYAADLALIEPLASLLTRRVADEMRPDCIVPMPLSAQRLRERGFNQSLEIGRAVAARLEIPLFRAACRRIRHTAPQAGLPLDQRQANIRGAFACDTQVNAMRVAVIDDVITSGATLNEVARVLLKAGAVEVRGWVVARTERA